MRGIRHLQLGVLLAVLSAVAISGCAGINANDNENNVNNANQNNVNPVRTEVPVWIKPGAVLLYDHRSAFVSGAGDDKKYSSAVHLQWQLHIDAVTKNSITFTASYKNVEYPIPGETLAPQTWTYGKSMELVPWIDPKDPAGTVVSPVGMPYTVFPSYPYTLPTNGQVYPHAVLMAAEIPDTGTMYKITYDADTGLVLAYSYICPSEEMFIYYQGMQAI
jgi:hypothetical protein